MNVSKQCFHCGEIKSFDEFGKGSNWCKKCTRERARNRSQKCRRALPNGIIYFISGEKTNLVKIGYTTDLSQRLESLQSASPDRIVLLGIKDGTVVDEKNLHKLFAIYRVYSEWFQQSQEIQQYIHENTRHPQITMVVVNWRVIFHVTDALL